MILAGLMGALAAGAMMDVFSDGQDSADGTDGEAVPPAPSIDQIRADTELTGSDLLGGVGNDLLTGTDGADDLAGGGGNDTLHGMEGDDWIFGDDTYDPAGNDVLYGGEGSDTLAGNGGHDTLNGGDGDDRLFGGEGDDRLIGDDGTDWLDGGDGDDWLSGGKGDDDLAGGLGDDTLSGGEGADSLHGGDGNDVLYGAAGDWLDGNDGDDTFIIAPDSAGIAHVTDYAKGDRIELEIAGAEPVVSLIRAEDGSAMVLVDGAAVVRVQTADALNLADIVVRRT